MNYNLYGTSEDHNKVLSGLSFKMSQISYLLVSPQRTSFCLADAQSMVLNVAS